MLLLTAVGSALGNERLRGSCVTACDTVTDAVGMLTGAGKDAMPLGEFSTTGGDSTTGTGSKSVLLLTVGRGGRLLPSVCASRACVPPDRMGSERMASTAASVAACGETGLAASSVALSPAELPAEAGCGCDEYDGLGSGEANARAACAAGVTDIALVVSELATCTGE